MVQKKMEAAEQYLGKADAFTLDEAAVRMGDPNIEIVEGPTTAMKDWIETEAFMNEKVLVMVQPSNDPNDADMNFVQVWINGVIQTFKRGNPQWVRRCYVERLARAKATFYSQRIDERLGESMNTLSPVKVLRYPFSVLQDKNPNGGAWLQQVLAEPA
jgi:hypothetical protein